MFNTRLQIVLGVLGTTLAQAQGVTFLGAPKTCPSCPILVAVGGSLLFLTVAMFAFSCIMCCCVMEDCWCFNYSNYALERKATKIFKQKRAAEALKVYKIEQEKLKKAWAKEKDERIAEYTKQYLEYTPRVEPSSGARPKENKTVVDITPNTVNISAKTSTNSCERPTSTINTNKGKQPANISSAAKTANLQETLEPIKDNKLESIMTAGEIKAIEAAKYLTLEELVAIEHSNKPITQADAKALLAGLKPSSGISDSQDHVVNMYDLASVDTIGIGMPPSYEDVQPPSYETAISTSNQPNGDISASRLV